ncbi:VOC family protein [Micromonospora chersina]|uniref:VOC family protein n=1 Tax=Micromonospora chersina TaxID=47854 RepID=UPI00371CB2AA
MAVRLVTRTAGHYGLTSRHLGLARRISALARDLDLPADPTAVQSVQVTVDALDLPAVTLFWRALLGYEHRAGNPEDLVDLRGRGPAFWFERMDAPRPQRNRMHVDVWVPYDRAEARGRGGRLARPGGGGNHPVTEVEVVPANRAIWDQLSTMCGVRLSGDRHVATATDGSIAP